MESPIISTPVRLWPLWGKVVGKSVSQYAGLQLIPRPTGEIVEGEVWFEGKNLLELDQNMTELRDMRGGKIGIVFQEPMTSLNPDATVGRQIMESLFIHTKKLVNRKPRKKRWSF